MGTIPLNFNKILLNEYYIDMYNLYDSKYYVLHAYLYFCKLRLFNVNKIVSLIKAK